MSDVPVRRTPSLGEQYASNVERLLEAITWFDNHPDLGHIVSELETPRFRGIFNLCKEGGTGYDFKTIQVMQDSYGNLDDLTIGFTLGRWIYDEIQSAIRMNYNPEEAARKEIDTFYTISTPKTHMELCAVASGFAAMIYNPDSREKLMRSHAYGPHRRGHKRAVKLYDELGPSGFPTFIALPYENARRFIRKNAPLSLIERL